MGICAGWCTTCVESMRVTTSLELLVIQIAEGFGAASLYDVVVGLETWGLVLAQWMVT